MTKDIDPSAVRVLYRNRGPFLVLGPLGCYHVGQVIELPDGKVTVTSIDHDGAGIARTDEQIAAAGDASHTRTCYAWDFATARAQEGMLAQQERNRREHDVVLPDEMAQAA